MTQRIRLIAAVCGVIGLFSAVGQAERSAPNSIAFYGSDTDPQKGPIYLNQGWNGKQRQEFYHLSGGTQMLPYDWFISLEQKDNTDLFVSDHNFAQLHLVPNRKKDDLETYRLEKDLNPKKLLPVGLAITKVNTGREYVGINCAFCHTGQLNYTATSALEGGKAAFTGNPLRKTRYTIYVDGGPSMQYNFRFLRELAGSLRVTLADEAKFSRFARRVFEQCKERRSHSVEQKAIRCGYKGEGDKEEVDNALYHEQLKREVTDFTYNLLGRARIDTLEWGFGRFDALGRGTNMVFSNTDPDNVRHTIAPVSIPQIWNAWKYDVVQWSGLIRHPIARNIGQTIGVGAGLFEDHPGELFLTAKPATAVEAFASSTNVPNIIELEQHVRALKPPVWPQEFPSIDLPMAKEGKKLYAAHCKHCHLPTVMAKPANSGELRKTEKALWERGQVFEVNIISQDEIGTDEVYLYHAGTRLVDTGVLAPFFEGQRRLNIAKATEIITSAILQRHNPNEDSSGNKWESKPDRSNPNAPKPGYMARPHAAIWATPPFLHNGSVPSLYDLLLPVDGKVDYPPPFEVRYPQLIEGRELYWKDVWKNERGGFDAHRASCFLLGDLEFDPVKVGYTIHLCDFEARADNPYSGWNFETTKWGNSNRGHEFRNYDRSGRKFDEADCRAFEQGGRDGIVGCELKHVQRMEIIEYLKTCDLDDILEWDEKRPYEAKVNWDPDAPPKTNCPRRAAVGTR